MSAVWNYFKLEDEKSKTAEYNVCKASVSRGGVNVGSFNTTNLIKHLKKHHNKEYEEFQAACTAKQKKGTPQQQTLQQSFQRREKLSPENPKAKQITEKVVEFIVLDDQPISVVENSGFKRLMEHLEPRYELPNRHLISDKYIPQKYSEVCQFIEKCLENAGSISFTTDVWSSDVCPLSLISLTAQWINTESFTLQNAVLHAKQFRGSHTGDSIAATTEEMLNRWRIEKSRVHVIVRDNASNVIKAMDRLGVASFGCFAHTLQLIVNEGVLAQRSVTDAVAIGRKIVGHFKHSPLAYSRFEDIQIQLNMPPKRLQQDLRTRWNSTFYMLRSLVEQKRALCAYTAEYDLPATLTANQWGTLEKVIATLAPFEELTKEVSSAAASASDVIPLVSVLKRILGRECEADEGIKAMKGTLLQAVNRRFKDLEYEALYSVATLLDPRYKDRYFSGAETSSLAKDTLIAEAKKMEEVMRTSEASEAAQGTTGDLPPESAASGQAVKRPWMEEATSRTGLVGSAFDEILKESTVEPGPEANTGARIEVQTYLSEPTIPRSDSPLLYWKINKPRLPTLANTAAKFLSAPSTSVESERLFSTASIVLDERRSRLAAEKVEMLIFLKKNLPLMFK